MKRRLVFGSGRFNSVVVKNLNEIQFGGFDVPTKLVKDGDILLCLPDCLNEWGMYPTHQDSWLCLSFPEDQDGFLQSSPVRELIEQANRGRQGELSPKQGLALADKADALVSQLMARFGGAAACKVALAELQAGLAGKPGRVVLLPDSISLEQAKELVEYDVVIGTPDEHDMDVVSIVGFVSQPTLFQLVNQLSGQRLDIISVPEDLGPNDVLTGGHPSFQSVAEMLLANGSLVSAAGRQLVSRLASQVKPAELAQKYLEVAEDFMSNAANRKSWVSRRNDPTVPQVKKAIPLYRVACDLLPRAIYMIANGRHTGGLEIAELAAKAGLAAEYQAIRSFLARQDACQEELEKTAEIITARLKEVKV